MTFMEKYDRKRYMTKRARKAKVVFTNGCFDIIHPGHIEVLEFAKSLGGKLVVGINSDRAVKLLKGQGRPINSESARKKVLESLRFVDQVVIFDDVGTYDIVRKIKPDILVKGEEGFTPEQVRERDQVPPEVEIKLCPHLGDYSTTSLINRMRAKPEKKG